MKRDDLKEMEQRYAAWSTEDLVKATMFDKDEYQSAAIVLMSNELKRRGVSQENLDAAQETVAKDIVETTKKLTGISGFLLLFIILLIPNLLAIFAIGLICLIRMFHNPSTVLLVLTVCDICAGLYGVFILILLIRKINSAPRHTLQWIYYILGLSILNVALVFLISGKLRFTSLLASMVFSLVWATYFTKSKRVAATYELHK